MNNLKYIKLKQFCFLIYILFSINLNGAQLCQNLFSEKEISLSQFFFPNNLANTRKAVKFSLRSHFKKIAQNSQNAFSISNKQFFAEITLENGQKVIGKVKAFGDSSASDEEAPFRKLRISFNADQGQEWILFVNTHLGKNNTNKWSPQGRILDGTSPFREALVYDLAHTINVQTGDYRRAEIEYTDVDTGETFKESALLLEHFKNTAEKKSGKIATENQFQTRRSNASNGSANVDVPEAIRAVLLQILVGNSDYMLEIYNTLASPTIYYQQLKNIALLKFGKDNSLHPIIYDFDIASIVTGHEITAASKPWEHLPEIEKDPVTMVMLRQLLKLRSLVKTNELKTEIDFFIKSKSALLETINKTEVDEVGRSLAIDHIEHFYKALNRMWEPEFKFILSKNVRLYEKPDTRSKNLLKRNSIEERPGSIRAGSPFIILAEENDFIKVLLIDTYYDLNDYTQRIGYISKKAIYSNSIPENQIPFFDSRSLFQ